jgi:hypothetical protein
VLIAGCGGAKSAAPPPASSSSSPVSGTSTPSAGSPTSSGTTGGVTPTAPTQTTPIQTAPSSTAPAPPASSPPLGSPINQPLWPFKTLSEAQAWEQSNASGGHQPWHGDAGATALAFTQGYLGFTGIDKVVSSTVSGREAHIGVGFALPSNPPGTATAAVLHLVRYGADANAPWEVVGSADTSLTLTAPAYGAHAASPLTAGGTITGVDDDVRVQTRQPSTTAPLGRSGPDPAGGTNTPWTTKATFTGATDPVLTVVAYTGGHLQAAERFAVTAIRTG